MSTEADEVDVNVTFYVPNGRGGVEKMAFKDVTIKATASPEKLLPALLRAFSEIKMGEENNLILLIKAPDGKSLAGARIGNGSHLVIMPEDFDDGLVKRKS